MASSSSTCNRTGARELTHYDVAAKEVAALVADVVEQLVRVPGLAFYVRRSKQNLRLKNHFFVHPNRTIVAGDLSGP